MNRLILPMMVLFLGMGTVSMQAQNANTVDDTEEYDCDGEPWYYSTSLNKDGGKAWFARQYPVTVKKKPNVKDFALAICNGYPTNWTRIVKSVLSTGKPYTDKRRITTSLHTYEPRYGYLSMSQDVQISNDFTITYWNRTTADNRTQKIILVDYHDFEETYAPHLLMAFNYDEGSNQLVPALADWKRIARLAEFDKQGDVSLPCEDKYIAFYYQAGKKSDPLKTGILSFGNNGFYREPDAFEMNGEWHREGLTVETNQYLQLNAKSYDTGSFVLMNGRHQKQLVGTYEIRYDKIVLIDRSGQETEYRYGRSCSDPSCVISRDDDGDMIVFGKERIKVKYDDQYGPK